MLRRNTIVLVPTAWGGVAQDQKEDPKVAPHLPTPQTIVDKMLQLGKLKPGEKMNGLGSGGGDIDDGEGRSHRRYLYRR